MGSTVMLVERLHPGHVNRKRRKQISAKPTGILVADEYFDSFRFGVADGYHQDMLLAA